MSEMVVNTSQTRSIEQLNDEEKKQVEEKLASLEYMSPVSIIQFGSENKIDVISLSISMISKFKVKDFEELQELIVNLVGDLKTVDIESLLGIKKKRLLSKRLGVSKKEEKNNLKILTQQVSIEKSLNEVEDKLVADKILIFGDIEFCYQMMKKIYEYASDQEIDYITIQETLKKAGKEKEKLEGLLKQNPNNIEYSYKISELDRVIERLESKADRILKLRNSILQTVTQIRLVQEGDELMVSKIDDAIINVIPSWKSNFVNLKETLDGLNKVIEDVKRFRDDAIKILQNIQSLALQLQSGTNLSELED